MWLERHWRMGKKKKIKPFLNKDKGKAFPQKVGHSFFNANSELQKVAFSYNINFTLHILEQDIWLKHPKGKKFLIAPSSQTVKGMKSTWLSTIFSLGGNTHETSWGLNVEAI